MVLRLDGCQQSRVLHDRLKRLVDHGKVVLLLGFLGYDGLLLHVFLLLQNFLKVLVHLGEHHFVVYL